MRSRKAASASRTRPAAKAVTLGAGPAVKIPAWVPSYPGSKPEGTFSAQGGEGQGGMFAFKTGDNPKKVLDWYQQSLEGAGFQGRRECQRR